MNVTTIIKGNSLLVESIFVFTMGGTPYLNIILAHFSELGVGWSLAYFQSRAETELIKAFLAHVFDGRAGFSICAGLIRTGGRSCMIN